MKLLRIIGFILLVTGMISCDQEKDDPGVPSGGIPQDGLIREYSFESNCKDLTNNGGNGTTHGTLLHYVNSLSGKGLAFRNEPDTLVWVNDYVSFPAFSADDISVSFWVFFEDNGFWADAAVFSMGNPDKDTCFMIKASHNGLVQMSIGSRFGDTLTAWTHLSGKVIDDQQWHHVVATIGGSTLKFYVDAVMYDQDILAFPFSIRNKPYYLSRQEWDFAPFATTRFKGLVDEMLIYDRALTPAEVDDIYEAQKF